MAHKDGKKVIASQKTPILLLDYRLFFGLMMMSCLYLFTHPFLRVLGCLAIICIFGLSIGEVITRSGSLKVSETWLWFAIYSAYSVIAILRTPTVSALYSGAIQIVLVLPICIYSSSSVETDTLQGIFAAGKMTLILLLIPASVVLFAGGGTALFMFNDYFSPTIYKIMLPCTFFVLALSKDKLLRTMVFSSVFFAMGERTSSMCLIVVYITYLVLGSLKRSRFAYKMSFVFICLCILVFPVLYVELQYTDLGAWLNSVSREYTGGNFFSGRNRVWEVAFKYIRESPMFGYGVDNRILSSNEIYLSTHNLYIYLLMQGGIVGLGVFLLFMYSLWTVYFPALHDGIVRMATAYLVGVMVYVSFELALIINAVTISLFLWLVLGIGVMRKNNYV